MANQERCNRCGQQCHSKLRKRAKTCPCRECIVKAMCMGALVGDECDLWFDWFFKCEDTEHET